MAAGKHWPARQRDLLVGLATFMRDDTREVSVGDVLVAEAAALSLRWARVAKRELRKAGCLDYAPGKGKTPTRWTVLCLPESGTERVSVTERVILRPSECHLDPGQGGTERVIPGVSPNGYHQAFDLPGQGPRGRATRRLGRRPGPQDRPLMTTVETHQFEGDGQADTCTRGGCGLPARNRRHAVPSSPVPARRVAARERTG
jgi:hypothetical protein